MGIYKILPFFYLFFTILLTNTFPADAKTLLPAASSAEETTLLHDPESLLGMNLKEAYSVFGAPDEITVHRNENPQYDDVVFIYKPLHVSFFWFENRVWVIRFHSGYEKNILGVRPGMKKEEVMTSLNYTSREIENSLVFFLKDRGFPVRLRVYFTNDIVNDIYLYRGDF
ncbi:MAG: hypothetical protein JW904_00190 [Spirochaetales bacterium]|nr:hypothetical protein [Spirochaetales bacterium]